MKIKKKELRRGLAQLPINYPDPDVIPEALPGGALDMDAEFVNVECICKRLAHNEVVVRDAALAAVPQYLEKLTRTLAEMETEYAEEIACVTAYFKAHPKTHNPYTYDNIPLALFEYRQRARAQDQQLRRRQVTMELKQERERQRMAKANYGRFGERSSSSQDNRNEGSGADKDGNASGVTAEARKQSSSDSGGNASREEHKAKYTRWMETWCDVELVFLKLARGLHFCLWHSAKPLVQLECAQRIADLIACPATVRSKVLFYGSLFRVLAREWPTIDRYRMDKYLALVRRLVYAWVSLVRDVAATDSAAAVREASVANAMEAASPRKTKKETTSLKRGRNGAAAAATAESEDKGAPSNEDEEGLSRPSAATNAKDIPEYYRRQNHSRYPQLCQVLQETFYILQDQIIPSATSVGLTMHICDVAFDELTKAFLPVPLFVTLAAGIPLYAMSQGNYVEKHVLDSFFPPFAGGVFASRRAAQILERLKRNQRKTTKAKSGAAASSPLGEEALAKESERLAAMDNDAILAELAGCCRLFSVSRGTARAVRALFSEAELVLQQSRSSDAYLTLTRTTRRRRIEREIEEVNETRSRVQQERSNKRKEKKAEQRDMVKQKVKARKKALLTGTAAAAEVSEQAIRRAVLEEEGLVKQRRTPRDTKRKKNYQLTKKDLYESDDDDDNS